MRTIRASEIGAYRYCRRAWWYQRQAMPNDNQENLTAGQELHEKHGRFVMASSCLHALAYLFLLLALMAAAAWITQALF
jgi:CRISPR/Cas system-associated exonuclease Cas4 (RecB family)